MNGAQKSSGAERHASLDVVYVAPKPLVADVAGTRVGETVGSVGINRPDFGRLPLRFVAWTDCAMSPKVAEGRAQ